MTDIQLDEQLLVDLGYGVLGRRQGRELLSAIYECLELEVGLTLARDMSDDDLDAFEFMIRGNDDAAALRWLTSTRPDYKHTVQSLFDEIGQDLRRASQERNT